MELRALFTDDRAVSSVIGVILMVAITVILASLVGIFVLGVGVGDEQPPSAAIDMNWDTQDVWITHKTGEDFTSDNTGESGACGASGVSGLGISIDGDDLTGGNYPSITEPGCWETPITSGDRIRVGNSSDNPSADTDPSDDDFYYFNGFEGGEIFRLVWIPPGGGSSQTIAEIKIPERIP